MIPLKDMTPRRSAPVITILLIVANFIVFFHQITLSPHAAESFIRTYGFVPAHVQLALAGGHYPLSQALIPLFTSMFLHAGWLHIIGNMWFLWIFGANAEDRLGSVAYLFVYLICGLGAGITQMIFTWGSPIPSIGASGAISGILGAYLVFFPRSRILSLVPLFIIWFLWRVPAVIFIGLWFLAQFFSGMTALGRGSSFAGGVAWWAHVGGFVLGLLFAAGARRGPRRAAEIYE